MSRHEGVSCDSCLKGNFRGRRYKCLVCYDYDLCGACYDNGSTTTRHTTDHPMQCILTRNDLELYYEGEGLEQQQAFTCPFCGKMGYTESALHEHVTADHTVSTFEVVCPICAAQPGGDPNLITDDFASHLSLEHRTGPRDLISFLDEPSGSRQSVRRIPHPTRGVGSSRNRNRSNMHFSHSSPNATSTLNTRDSVDPIAELLSQLSGVRRSTGSNSSASQLAHIQMQLQLERQQVRAARQQLERLPRRQNQSSSSGANHTGSATSNSHNNATAAGGEPTNSSGQNKNQEFLLTKILNEPFPELSDLDKQRRVSYVHAILLGSIRSGICMGSNPDLSSVLPALDLLNLGVRSDARGVTNISVGSEKKPFELRLPGKENTTSPQIDKNSQSAPTPLTRTIKIAGPTSEEVQVTNNENVPPSSPFPTKAKLLLANKMSNTSRPCDINTIRKIFAAKFKEEQEAKLLESQKKSNPPVS